MNGHRGSHDLTGTRFSLGSPVRPEPPVEKRKEKKTRAKMYVPLLM